MAKDSLKNYSSSSPVINSINKIEGRLVQAGATHIAKTYEGEKPTGLVFQIFVNETPLTFKLPSKVENVYNYMLRHKKMVHKKSVQDTTHRQASMTAWKILADWVDIQVSMILLEQAEASEVFLPYMLNRKGDKTLFEIVKEGKFKQLTQGG